MSIIPLQYYYHSLIKKETYIIKLPIPPIHLAAAPVKKERKYKLLSPVKITYSLMHSLLLLFIRLNISQTCPFAVAPLPTPPP